MKLQFNDKVYDILKWLCLIALPALSVLYSALAGVWGWPYAQEVATTINAVVAPSWARSSAFPRRTTTKTMAQAHGQWVTTGYRPGDVLIYDFSGTSYKTDHCGICESVSGQYVTAIEGNTSNGNTGSQSNGDGVYRRKRKLSLVLGAYRPKYTDYRAQLQKRSGLEDKTMDYLAAYKYGSDLIRKPATMK